MFSRKFKTAFTTSSNVTYRPLMQTRFISKWFDIFSGTNMASTIRLKVLRDLFLTRVLNSWTKSYMVHSVLKKCKKDRGMNKMLLYFRQVFFRPRTPLLVSATAAFRTTEEKSGPPKRCSRDITEKEIRRLIKDLDRVEDISQATLYCEGCDKRIVIDSKHKGVHYCDCADSKPAAVSFDGWIPYMEANDVIIWRKEYKPGGLYAYKVYGRYKNINAEDFAMIQVDGAYRKVWDTAVASLSVVENAANGLKDQTVLHWEVLWPALFTNRDYVFLRRHMMFDVKSRCWKHKDGIFPDKERCVPGPIDESCSPNVHSKAKEASLALDKKEAKEKEASLLTNNKVYVIVSRSCTHPNAPVKNAVRVMEYWSHMVVTTLNGPDRPGMEFVLTYYDEPAVGGLPPAVTSWAMGRAGPAFLERMHQAAMEYETWRGRHQKPPDFAPFEVSSSISVSYEREDDMSEEDSEQVPKNIPEVDEEYSTPEAETSEGATKDGSTQTRPVIVTPIDDEPRDGPKVEAESADTSLPLKYAAKDGPTDEERLLSIIPCQQERPKDEALLKSIPQTLNEEQHTTIIVDVSQNLPTEQPKTMEVEKFTTTIEKTNEPTAEIDGDSDDNELEKDDDSIEQKTSWWRYLYPLYYFV